MILFQTEFNFQSMLESSTINTCKWDSEEFLGFTWFTISIHQLNEENFTKPSLNTSLIHYTYFYDDFVIFSFECFENYTFRVLKHENMDPRPSKELEACPPKEIIMKLSGEGERVGVVRLQKLPRVKTFLAMVVATAVSQLTI